jgi:hypothetical protein
LTSSATEALEKAMTLAYLVTRARRNFWSDTVPVDCRRVRTTTLTRRGAALMD